ncbi:MAG: hypothetical protein KY476_02550 [Planctomycetes bacterium]|nr:hypothetical protein [Planctomycetota bacterium]
MESVIRNVKDIDANERRYLEGTLGRQLQENQQVVIRVIDLGVEPDAATRRAALADASAIARKGRANAAARGVSEEQVDAAVDEAIDHVRRHKL